MNEISGKNSHSLESIMRRLPDDIARTLRMMPESMSSTLEEIRFRTGRPVMVYAGGREYEMYRRDNQNLSAEEMDKIFNLLVHHSAYSYQEDIRNGFVTLDGGHRVGICGRAVTDGNGRVISIRNISSINIRRGREVIGVSDSIVPSSGRRQTYRPQYASRIASEMRQDDSSSGSDPESVQYGV